MEAYTIEHLSFSYPPELAGAHKEQSDALQSAFRSNAPRGVGAETGERDKRCGEDVLAAKPLQRGLALDDVSLAVREGELLVLCGRSGCGKTTLLRTLKPALAPYGERWGEVRFFGRPLDQLDEREQAARIGYVLQSPEGQIVTDKVWHELAFGLENLGLDSRTIRLRVAEMASFFGIQQWFHRETASLSGGEKQLLNLAAVMAMQPDVLLLDEPTSQLDPIAAGDFLETVRKINRELGTTVILSEQRLEEALPMADRALVLDSGRVLCCAAPREVCARLHGLGHEMEDAMPTPARVYLGAAGGQPADRGRPVEDGCPLTVGEGRRWLEGQAKTCGQAAPQSVDGRCGGDVLTAKPLQRAEGVAVATGVAAASDVAVAAAPALALRDVWFRYGREEDDVLCGLDLAVPAGRLTCIVGGNGAGKSTVLKLMAGLLRPYRGKVVWQGCGKTPPRIALLPQSPQSIFVENTVERDLLEMLGGQKLTRERKHERVREQARLLGLDGLLGRHPYDLSGGEQQRAAIAKLLLSEPQVLLLDEPTKGLDAHCKRALGGLLHGLTARGVTCVAVSHDVEFCAGHADWCAMLFDGAVAAEGEPHAFFSGNRFYTTAANRMARRVNPGLVTAEELARWLTK